MPIPETAFVIRLATGELFAGFMAGYPTATTKRDEAKTFTSRLGALGATAAGPAAFFDHAAIEPHVAQDAPAAASGPSPSPKA